MGAPTLAESAAPRSETLQEELVREREARARAEGEAAGFARALAVVAERFAVAIVGGRPAPGDVGAPAGAPSDVLPATLALLGAGPAPQAKTGPMDDKSWTVDQAAEFLGMSPDTLYRVAAQGKVPCLKGSGMKLRFIPSSLATWRKEQEHGGEPAPRGRGRR